MRRAASPAGSSKWRELAMWLLRLLAAILVIAIGAGLLIYALTGNRSYLALSVGVCSSTVSSLP
jgi:cytochrome c-type biogenesis protein CcmE